MGTWKFYKVICHIARSQLCKQSVTVGTSLSTKLIHDAKGHCDLLREKYRYPFEKITHGQGNCRKRKPDHDLHCTEIKLNYQFGKHNSDIIFPL